MDLLVALGTSAAWGLSVYELFAHAGESAHLYFEAGSGGDHPRALRQMARSACQAAKPPTPFAHSTRCAPERARIRDAATGNERDIALADVRNGDVAIVRPG